MPRPSTPCRSFPGLHHLAWPAVRWWPWLATAALAACASLPPPKADMAVAEAAVVNATNAGGVQWAPAEMRTAQEKLARARAAMVAQDHGLAMTLAHEADADAQLAATAARAAKSQRAAEAVQEANRVLREEMARKPSSATVKTP